jgi:acyl-CoA synthetase (AMP-forming)/AMP-acid ligase II
MSTEYDSKVHRHNNQDQDINEDIHTAIRCESGEEDAVIVFTSGTTSGSKGVRLSHKSLWIQSLAKLQRPCGYTQQTRMLASTVPLFHVGGLSSTLAVLLAGGTLVVPSSPLGFNPISVFQSVTSKTTLQSANTLVVVPAMLHSLLQHVSHHETYDSVKLLLIGGQSASPDTIQHVARVFPNARLVQTFACTEAASSMTFLEVKPEDGMQHSSLSNGPSGDCVGVPPPHVELALVDAESQRTIPIPFQVGVFATRGPHVMNGYWTRNGASENLSRDEWYVTSDLGFYDENGQFYFSGRAKDVIRTGGETVIALEVERILQSHPGIRECSVFALPDERFGETVCAAIVCNNTNTLALSDVRSFCSRRSLAGYKQPRAVYLVNELPRNSSGKVVKYQLVERFREPQPLRSQL